MHEGLGEMDRFWAITEEYLEEARAHGHKRIEARAVSAFAERAAEEGRLADARLLLVQAVRMDCELGNLPFLAVDLVRFASLLCHEGNPWTATLVLSRAASLNEDTGFALESWMSKTIDEALALVHAQLDDATFDAAWEQGEQLTLDEAVALALGESEQDA